MCEKLSRNAELVALAFFGFGKKASVVFNTPSRITEQCQRGIDELKSAGMIEDLPPGEMPRGAVGWRGTENIGFPMADFDRPREEETFSLIGPEDAVS